MIFRPQHRHVTNSEALKRVWIRLKGSQPNRAPKAVTHQMRTIHLKGLRKREGFRGSLIVAVTVVPARIAHSRGIEGRKVKVIGKHWRDKSPAASVGHHAVAKEHSGLAGLSPTETMYVATVNWNRVFTARHSERLSEPLRMSAAQAIKIGKSRRK